MARDQTRLVPAGEEPIGELSREALAAAPDLRPEARAEQCDPQTRVRAATVFLRHGAYAGRRERMPQSRSFIGGRCGGR